MSPTPRRTEILALLRESKPELARFFVRSILLFGSVARDEAAPGSDVDLLVELDRPVGLFSLVRLKLRLEEILGATVDLTTPDSLKPTLREQILREAIRAA